jgi:hypothetical protein
MNRLLLCALLAVSGCIGSNPSTSSAEQQMICLTCGGDGGGVTYPEAVDVSHRWAVGQGGSRISVSCDTIEVGGAVGYSCAVGFDFNGRRWTAGCTVWDNTSAGSGSGTNSCYIIPNDGQ